MVYRPCPDIPPPSDADVDTAETVEAASAIERGERHLRMLAELAEIAMTLARSLGELALTRIEDAGSGDAKLAPGEDPTAAFSKISQTIRRTIDLEARLSEPLAIRRTGLAAARAARRAALDEAHKTAVDDAIDYALADAFCGVHPEPDGDELDKVQSVAEDFRWEFDEFRDYLDRPVGETVARLCAKLNFDPTSCIDEGGTWMVRCPPQERKTARNPMTGAPVSYAEPSLADLSLPDSVSGLAATGPPP